MNLYVNFFKKVIRIPYSEKFNNYLHMYMQYEIHKKNLALGVTFIIAVSISSQCTHAFIIENFKKFRLFFTECNQWKLHSMLIVDVLNTGSGWFWKIFHNSFCRPKNSYQKEGKISKLFSLLKETKKCSRTMIVHGELSTVFSLYIWWWGWLIINLISY